MELRCATRRRLTGLVTQVAEYYPDIFSYHRIREFVTWAANAVLCNGSQRVGISDDPTEDILQHIDTANGFVGV